MIDSDLILVLGSGRVLEFGSPSQLIQDRGAFASMVSDTGDAMSTELRQRPIRSDKERKKKDD